MLRIAGVFLQPLHMDPRLDPDPEEPLGVEYVLAAAQVEGHIVRLFTVFDAPIGDLWQEILKFDPDIVAFSVFTTHAPRTLETAKRLKQWKPGILTVAGGPHPSAVPDFVLNPAIDVCVIGEGEKTFCEILSASEYGIPLESVHGVAIECERELVITTPRDRLEDLDNLPYPIRETRYYSESAHSISYPKMSECNWRPVLFSRGCSMPCKFCSSRELWGNKVRFRSPDNMINELRYLRDTQGVNSVFFEDLTFTLNRQRFMALCSALKRANLGIHWSCETHINTMDEKTIGAMKSAGCVKVLWGIENLSDVHLETLNKRQTRKDIERSLRIAAKHGILNWGCCIIGFPWETENDILETARELLSLDIHQLRISIATPLPGSEWHKEMPSSALQTDLSLYDTNHLVYDHPTISAERMKELQNEIFVLFYRSTKYRDRMARMCSMFPHLKDSFDEFLAYVDSRAMLVDEGVKDISEDYPLLYSNRDISDQHELGKRECVEYAAEV